MLACDDAIITSDIEFSRKRIVTKKEKKSMMGCVFNVVANC